ncbi:hypothetical protein LZ30DRAFT_362292 [Colletotrichum cereale]|nr:hypothetical protein LZ30DRAFT_362292 [Colletotrichum cereale]
MGMAWEKDTVAVRHLSPMETENQLPTPKTEDGGTRHALSQIRNTTFGGCLTQPNRSMWFAMRPDESLVRQPVALHSILYDPYDLCLMSTCLVIPLRASSRLLFSVTNQQCFLSWNLCTISRHSFRPSADWSRIHNPKTPKQSLAPLSFFTPHYFQVSHRDRTGFFPELAEEEKNTFQAWRTAGTETSGRKESLFPVEMPQLRLLFTHHRSH